MNFFIFFASSETLIYASNCEAYKITRALLFYTRQERKVAKEQLEMKSKNSKLNH